VIFVMFQLARRFEWPQLILVCPPLTDKDSAVNSYRVIAKLSSLCRSSSLAAAIDRYDCMWFRSILGYQYYLFAALRAKHRKSRCLISFGDI
jgi:hypothetical protein